MAVMNHRNGMRAASSFDSAIDQLLDEAARVVGDRERTWKPGYNVYEDEQGMTFQLSLPGIEPSAVEVEVQDDTVTIRGERTWQAPEGCIWHARGIPEGKFSTAFRLPQTVDAQRSTATYKHGLLTIAFPKREEAKPRRISVSIS
jgi:HSP20 family protein